MAQFGEHIGIQFEALEDLSSRYGFAITLDDGKIANDGAEASGILMNKPKSGEAANCGTVGELPFQAGGAVTKGDKLTVTTSGYCISANSGSHLIGKATVTVTSGSMGKGQFNFNNPIYAFTSSFLA